MAVNFDGKNRRYTYKNISGWLMSLKMVDQLGAFKLPVEVVQYGAVVCTVSLSLRAISHHSDLRNKLTAVTDMKNYISILI